MGFYSGWAIACAWIPDRQSCACVHPRWGIPEPGMVVIGIPSRNRLNHESAITCVRSPANPGRRSVYDPWSGSHSRRSTLGCFVRRLQRRERQGFYDRIIRGPTRLGIRDVQVPGPHPRCGRRMGMTTEEGSWIATTAIHPRNTAQIRHATPFIQIIPANPPFITSATKKYPSHPAPSPCRRMQAQISATSARYFPRNPHVVSIFGFFWVGGPMSFQHSCFPAKKP